MQNSWNRANVHGTPFASWIFIQSPYHPDLSLRFSNWTLFSVLLFARSVLRDNKNILGFWTYNLGRGGWILSRPPLSLSTIPQLESLIQTLAQSWPLNCACTTTTIWAESNPSIFCFLRWPFLVDNICLFHRSYQIFLFSFKYQRQSNREINEDLYSFCPCFCGYVCSWMLCFRY